MDKSPDRAPPIPVVPRVLVIGFGNPGRCDDGLGPALVDRLATLFIPGVTVESDYQLAIEHAALVARHDIIVFADAATDVPESEPYYLRPIQPAPDTSCFTHHVSPSAVLELAAGCFDARPRAWLLGIRPVDVESFSEGLTSPAERHLEAALAALRDLIASLQADGATAQRK